MSVQTMVSLVDILSAHLAPIQSVLLSHLLPRDVIALTLTCSALGRLWQTFVATQYNINRLLRPYFDSPRQFRSVQGKCNALIVGSSARYFFTTVAPEDSDLNIHVQAPQVDTLRDYLLSQGYTKDSSDRPNLEGYSRPHAEGRVVLSIINEDTYTIDEDSNIIRKVFHCQDTTAAGSFITWNKAYCLYPHELLNKQEYYAMVGYSECLARSQKSLNKEGLLMRPFPSPTGTEMCFVTAIPRQIGDERTLMIALEIAGIDSPGFLDGSLESSTFRMWWLEDNDVDDDGNPNPYRGYFALDCYSIRYPILKYTYGVFQDSVDGFERYIKQCDDLRARLEELTVMELLRMKSSERPVGRDELESALYGGINLSDLKGTFIPPETWKYYDEEVINFLNQAWNYQVDPERFAAPEELTAK